MPEGAQHLHCQKRGQTLWVSQGGCNCRRWALTRYHVTRPFRHMKSLQLVF